MSLTPNGKPMRALRVLADAPDWITEHEVYRDARRWDESGYWHGALRSLVRYGYAEVANEPGRLRRRYRITDAGREALA